MKHVEYKTQNTCARVISFDITDDNKITNLQFLGGCNGNLKAISKLLEGFDAEKAVQIFELLWSASRKDGEAEGECQNY